MDTTVISPEDRQFLRQIRIFGIVWTVVLYISIPFSLYGVYVNRPELLRGWPLVGIVLLIAVFVALYHMLYYRAMFHWPMSPRISWLYFPAQITILAVLLRLEDAFMGLGWALLAHVVSVLPPRRWPLPYLATTLVMAWSLGLIEGALQGDPGGLVGFGFAMAIYAALALFFAMVIHQRFRLSQLVTDLRRARDEIERYAAQAEELAALHERARLAREMHDSLGHALVLVNVKLEAAQRLYTVDPQRGAAELEATRALVRESMADLRRSLANLRAPLPDHHHLPAALARTADEFAARAGLAVTCQVDTELPPLPEATTEALWRVAREALTNVERHAAAASASLALCRDNGMLILRVVDDGSGVRPADLARPGHYGVIGMRERVEALGGQFQITARPGGGTEVEARVPLEH